ncbi:RagB/SusD family nutrient uptake outer membrane protein [Psychroserpens sp. Hel_I_66]|uniref:RagB/SusD family nutrient uptake outer membrane protein n=1 Tax=Psychroserpens sp. Hel_I_66 TaxID=1250004 RepID=UPI0006462527|nr:RagB/SusD family nutrient uptake outer membrane protein [Psychroserpens sp. Hel_I_66]
MKKIIIILGILATGFFTSCEEFDGDFLEAPAQSTLDESVIFSSPDLTKSAIDGIVEPMGQTNSYRGRFIPFYGFNTDSEYNYSSDEDGSSQGALMIYDATPSNSQMNTQNNAWAQMYAGIERANICIRGLRTYGNPEPGTVLGQYLGEALTLRAIYYADLMKAWGDVQYRFEPIVAETVFIPKTDREVIYKKIIEDLGEAATLVAWPNETAQTTTTERINKAFVKSFRARLALVASGFQQYPDGIRRANDPALSVANMYTLALNEANDVINSGTASLNPSFETFWRNYNEEVLAAGNESLWEIPFADGRGRVLFSFAVRHRGVDQHTGQPRGGIAGPLPTVFYDFDEADTRRDVTCVPYQWGNPIEGIAQQELVGLNTWYFGKYRYEWMNRYVTSTNDDGVNKIYMRYAEVLLIAAESANELQGPGAAAPYLKEIRMRAFPSELHPEKVDAYVNALGSQQAMLDAIIEEYNYEFTGEMIRKQNLIRWNLLGTNLDEAKAKMFNLKNRTGEYSDVPTTLYFKYEEDGETLDIYGLNRDEDENPGPEFSAVDWTMLEDDTINSLYKPGVNPDDRQFWPIWQVFIDASNGQLVNDYGY